MQSLLRNRKISSRFLVAIVATIILTSGLTSILVYSYSTSNSINNTVFQYGNGLSPYTYLIYTESGMYYAKNGITGAITNSTSFNTVFMYCANIIGNHGGSISLKSGTFVLTSAILLTSANNNLTIRGEGKGTVLQVGGNGFIAIRLVSPNYITITDLQIDGNRRTYPTSQAGLYIAGLPGYDTFRNLWINNTGSQGIYFDNAQRSTFDSIWITDSGGDGFVMKTVGGETQLNHVFVYDSGGNGWVLDGVNYASFQGCYAVGNGYNGMLFTGTGMFSNTFNTIVNSYFLNNGVNAGTYSGINISTTGNMISNLITNCVFYDDQSPHVQEWGMYYNHFGNDTISNCVFYSNKLGGINTATGGANVHVVSCWNQTAPNTSNANWIGVTGTGTNNYYNYNNYYGGTGGISTSSYIVWQNATGYYATNGTTGQIDFSITGLADAQPVIQDSLDALTHGGTVFIKNSENKYYLENMLAITYDNTALQGEGRSTILYYNDHDPVEVYGGILIDLSYVTGSAIKDMSLDGNKAHNTATSSYGVCGGIRLDHCVSSTVDNVYVINARGFGIYTWYAWDCIIKNSEVYNATDNGICLQAGSQGFSYRCRVENCKVTFCSNVGMSLVYCQDCVITGCTIANITNNDANQGYNTHESFTWEGTVMRCVFSENVVWDQPTGTHAFEGVGNVVVGNMFNAVGEINIPNNFDVGDNIMYSSGLRVWDDFNNIHDNLFTECGIRLEGYADYNKIQSNTIMNNLYAIQFGGSPCNYTQIMDNTFINCTYAEHLAIISGATYQTYTTLYFAHDTVIRDNIGYNPVGYIASPINGTEIVDDGTSSTWVSETTYTSNGSPKLLFITGGTVTAIVFNGQTLASLATTMTLILHTDDTFSVTFSVAPTISILGQ